MSDERVGSTKESRRPRGHARQIFGVTDPVDVHDVWVEASVEGEAGAGWRAAYRLIPYTDGQPIVAEVRIFPADEWPGRQLGTWRAHYLGMHVTRFHRRNPGWSPMLPDIGQGITAQILRAVRLRPVHRETAQLTSMLAEGQDFTSVMLKVAGFKPGEQARPRRADAWPDERYARIAAAYEKAWESGSRSPVADVARRFRSLSRAQVRDALHTARARGLLTHPPGRGRAGGRVTPEGWALLPEPQRCAAETRAGARCKRPRARGKDTCKQHSKKGRRS